MAGESSLPRGDVFASRWHRMAFGVAVALYQQGLVDDWEEFRQRLIQEIQRWDRDCQEGKVDAGSWEYYERWLAALERLLTESGILSREEIEARARQLLASPEPTPEVSP
ncbi:hypothetical protein HRbin24_01206 [bacterium HR24]|nr:hypothetical protein HRbin24_01206 [bacterium HR24]